MKRYLSIPGSLLLIAAFIRATVNVEWDATGAWLAAAGLLIVGITVIWNWKEVVEWIRDPRGVFAVTTGISVAVFVALLVMVNIAVWYNPWSLDLTASGRNEVSDDTLRILARLQQPVALRQFGRANADARLEQLLRSFERETPQLRVEFADVDRERDQAARYGIIKLGTVIVLSGDKFRKVEEPNEQALVTAILQVTTEQDRLVCFLSGHGERGLADTGATGLGTLRAILEASNYRTERISLLEGDVPMACAASVIAGARQAYSAEEMQRLATYADNAGRLAILLEPDPAPSFADWLTPRGLNPGTGSIIDASGAGRQVGEGPRTALAAAYGDHPITRGFNLLTMYDGARPLRVAEPAYGGKPPDALAQTSQRSFATTVTDAAPAFDQTRDTIGPLTLAAAATIGAPARPDRQVRVAVFGDSDFISNAFVRRQGNRDFFLRTLAWLLGEQEATIVAVDSRENRRLELTEGTRAWMYLINLGLMPLIPLAAGIIVYVRSRR